MFQTTHYSIALHADMLNNASERLTQSHLHVAVTCQGRVPRVLQEMVALEPGDGSTRLSSNCRRASTASTVSEESDHTMTDTKQWGQSTNSAIVVTV